jgi:hypothetical protein
MVCISGVPSLLGDLEYFVALAGGLRRPVTAGDHLPVDHPLVAAWPDAFAPSPEPPGPLVIGIESRETIERRRAEHAALLPRLGRRIVPVCLRCGAVADAGVDLLDQPTAAGLVNELTGLDDSDWIGRRQVEAKYSRAVNEWSASVAAVDTAIRAWAQTHTACPPDTPAEPEIVLDEGPLYWRESVIRTAG